MLQRLTQYTRDHMIDAEAGFTPKDVRWLLEFSQSGKFIGIHDLADPDDKHSKGRVFPKTPHLKFTSGTPMRHFLVDSAEYALLYEADKPDKNLKAKHAFFLALLTAAGEQDKRFAMLATQLSDMTVRNSICKALSERKAKPDNKVTFAIQYGGDLKLLVEDDSWHDWWRQYWPTLFKKRKQVSAGSPPVRCQLTGALTTPRDTHPKIKGLGGVGGKVEANLISFNQDAFCSYGLKKSANAAVSDEAAEQYAAALNDLIERKSVSLAGAKVVYWYAGSIVTPKEDPFRMLFGDREQFSKLTISHTPSEREKNQANCLARDLLEAIRTGQRPDLGRCRFHTVTVSGNSARVVIRNWAEGQFEELATCVGNWQEDLRILNLTGQSYVETPGFEACVTSVLPERGDRQEYVDWVRSTGNVRESLWTTALNNHCPSHSVVARVLLRNRQAMLSGEIAHACDPEGERRPRRLSAWYTRMSLLKCFCVRIGDSDMKAYLNEDHPDPAYHAGRMLAVFQHIQSISSGTPKASVLDRFYGAASTSPGLIAARIWNVARHHLRNIKDKFLREDLFNLLVAIHSRIGDSMPTTLSLKEQSLFQLGFFQQQPFLPTAQSGRRFKTAKGFLVRSKSEVILANLLDDLGVKYEYERPLLTLGITEPNRWPDFSIERSDGQPPIFIEHLGLIDRPAYQERWNQKLSQYRQLGIDLAEAGGGPNGMIVTTSETEVLDIPALRIRLQKYFSN